LQHIPDSLVDELVSPEDAQASLLDAFKQFGAGTAAMQQRMRTEAGGVKLSTLGAVIPGQKVAGAKVYTTIAGRFTFVILLFSTEDGRPLASFDADAITRLRTAACSVIAARYLARPRPRHLAIFGAGAQGSAHAQQMASAFELDRITICTRHPSDAMLASLSARCDAKVSFGDVSQALDEADIVVTASRSATPLFEGERLPKGCFVAAIGSSLPTTRELDDTALRRASVIAVEWREQSLREAGDLGTARPDAVISARSSRRCIDRLGHHGKFSGAIDMARRQ
jgi:ornithine cyclodeaminase